MIKDFAQIRRILQLVAIGKVRLRGGMNRRIDPETATIREVAEDALIVDATSFDVSKEEVFLSFELEGQPYFFQTHHLRPPIISKRGAQALLHLALPLAIYRSERRERLREPLGDVGWSAFVVGDRGERVEVRVEDRSPGGFGLSVPSGWRPAQGSPVTLSFPESPAANDVQAVVRHVSGASDGVAKVGLRIRQYEELLPIEERARILADSWSERIGRQVRSIRGTARWALNRGKRKLGVSPDPELEPRVVRYRNEADEEIVGLLDVFGEAEGAPAVVIPPAWGRSKETLLPLAETIGATFAASGRSVTVIRFDGIRKRGESFNEPSCRVRGREHHRFLVSQGYKDILTTLDFMDECLSPSAYALVTFSASSIDGRAAIARDPGRRIKGWISVVGPPDLQSAMRVISGGIDYVAGAERGVQFGFREVLGIEMDLDLANVDAHEHGLAFFDDALREFREIDVPITWLHGRHDAWMNLARVREALSCGDQRNRRLIVLPTGHQLRSSSQALETFQLISHEASRMLLGEALEPVQPDLVALEARSRAERARVPRDTPDLLEFWKDYLLGRDGALGMELVLQSPSYRALARQQVELLGLAGGERILDLGCGTGVLVDELLREGPPVALVGIDFVREVLVKVKQRCASQSPSRGTVGFVEADFDSAARWLLPLASESADAVVGSLLLSYVSDPRALLAEVGRCLRPGGVAVFSTLQRDADFSKIWVEDERVLRSAAASESPEESGQLERSLQSFLNDAAKLLDLEELGVFRFWEEHDFQELVASVGFSSVEIHRGLGDPTQAIIAVARR